MDIKKLFRDAEIGKVHSFHTLAGEEVIGKVTNKDAKRGRNGGTVLTIETDQGVRLLSFRDCALPEKVEAQLAEQPVTKRETAAERIARITRETQEAMARRDGTVLAPEPVKVEPAKVEEVKAEVAAKPVPMCPLFAPVDVAAWLARGIPGLLTENLLTEIVLVERPEVGVDEACFVAPE